MVRELYNRMRTAVLSLFVFSGWETTRYSFSNRRVRQNMREDIYEATRFFEARVDSEVRYLQFS